MRTEKGAQQKQSSSNGVFIRKTYVSLWEPPNPHSKLHRCTDADPITCFNAGRAHKMPSVPSVYPILKNCQGEFQNSLRAEQNSVVVQSLLLEGS